ncbi:hypothetical protein EJ04DRAFT_551919 [Polyplosphaeria fusca]|uniref:Uncharacterized protein n=1 Tax=Polyplosphaeria fusca TaxID=682080 RepID=A0A9P4R2N2_9PLEO|nr:hypothetical protein EJ04DRAFT_551919 [Polyplosphaeria fusca]
MPSFGLPATISLLTSAASAHQTPPDCEGLTGTDITLILLYPAILLLIYFLFRSTKSWLNAKLAPKPGAHLVTLMEQYCTLLHDLNTSLSADLDELATQRLAKNRLSDADMHGVIAFMGSERMGMLDERDMLRSAINAEIARVTRLTQQMDRAQRVGMKPEMRRVRVLVGEQRRGEERMRGLMGQMEMAVPREEGKGRRDRRERAEEGMEKLMCEIEQARRPSSMRRFAPRGDLW